jgi:predicted nuclease of predicted toxin-antitoxin system
MKFLVDECTGPTVAHWLEQRGHDVFSVYDRARGIDDDKVIGIAQAEGRILITNDRGFGRKSFANDARITASFFFAWLTNGPPTRFACLINLISQYSDALSSRFVVVTETPVRFAKT